MQDITCAADDALLAELAPPERLNIARHLLALNAGRADRLAYIDDTRRVTYGVLADEVQRCAGGLMALGLRREERVLMVMHDSVDFVVCFLGALYAGLVPVPVNTLLTAADHAYMLQHSGARAVVVTASLLPSVQEAINQGGRATRDVQVVVSGDAAATHAAVGTSSSAPVNGSSSVLPNGSSGAAPGSSSGASMHAGPFDVDATQATWPPPATRVTPFTQLVDSAPLKEAADTLGDDIGFWLYSSGSTGRPKGTVHTHANLWWTAALYGTPVLGLRGEDIAFSAAKLFFAYGLGNALTFPMSVGATTVLMAERPTPQAVFKRWVAHGVTVFYGAPTGYAGMLAAPDLPARSAVQLRLCSSAGEALPREIGEKFNAQYGCEIVDGIGSTEMLHIFLSNRPGDVNYGSTGRAVPGYRLRLVAESGEDAGPGEIGDLYVAGPSAALMYWAQRDKSRATFLGEWTRTGDKYSVDERGCYVYAGRSDDMLKVSGVYVSPFEVEATLMQHPAVLECAVFGKLDANGLTKTKACVVRKAGLMVTEIELQAFVKDRLAPFKYPRFIEFIDELPKTATGKIQRFRLRERERDADAAPAPTASP